MEEKIKEELQKLKKIVKSCCFRKNIKFDDDINDITQSTWIDIFQFRKDIDNANWFDKKEIKNLILEKCDEYLKIENIYFKKITEKLDGEKKRMKVSCRIPNVLNVIDKGIDLEDEEMDIFESIPDSNTTSESVRDRENIAQQEDNIKNKIKLLKEIEGWYAKEKKKIDPKGDLLFIKIKKLDHNPKITKEEKRILREQDNLEKEYEGKILAITGTKGDLYKIAEKKWREIENENWQKERDEEITRLKKMKKSIKEMNLPKESQELNRIERVEKLLQKEKDNKRVMPKMWRDPMSLKYYKEIWKILLKEEEYQKRFK